MSAIRTDIAVAGAGVAGLAAAAALAGAGFKVALVHRGPPLSAQGGQPAPPVPVQGAPTPAFEAYDDRVYAISPESRALLESVGAWDRLDPSRVAPVYDMRVYPAPATQKRPLSRDELHLSAYEARADALAWIIEQRQLQRALAASLPRRVREVVGEVSGLQWQPDGRAVVLQLADGTALRSALLVGADGAGSAVRAHAGIALQGRSYDQRAVVAHLRCERGHRDTAWQWFGPHGVLALLPMPEWPGLPADAVDADPVQGRIVSLVWSTSPERAQALLDGTPDVLAASIGEVTGHALGGLHSLTKPRAFDLARRWAVSPIGDRVVLVGDAAHVMHPLAGQGLNVGLGDVASLAAVLGEARTGFVGSGFDPGHALLLRRHRRRRAEPVAAMLALTDALQRLFGPGAQAPAALAMRLVRDAGWRFIASQPLLRRQLSRYATRQAPARGA